MSRNALKNHAERLRTIRTAMNLDMPSMAAVLDLPYHTYRSYEYAHRAVPQDVMYLAKLKQKQDRDFMRRLSREISQKIDRDFPFGIN